MSDENKEEILKTFIENLPTEGNNKFTINRNNSITMYHENNEVFFNSNSKGITGANDKRNVVIDILEQQILEQEIPQIIGTKLREEGAAEQTVTTRANTSQAGVIEEEEEEENVPSVPLDNKKSLMIRKIFREDGGMSSNIKTRTIYLKTKFKFNNPDYLQGIRSRFMNKFSPTEVDLMEKLQKILN